MATKRNQPIRAWESGDTVQGFALVSRKEVRQDRNGRNYVDMELTDSTGSMSAKVWADSSAMNSEFEAHDFVAFRGHVKLYREQLQISIDDCRRAHDGDRQHGFDESQLVPSTKEDVGDLWRRLGQVMEQVERPVLQQVVAHAMETWGERLKEHPAAKTMHHAYRGGLLEHVTSMAELALRVCGHYPQLDRDLVLLGVLFHDLGKIRELGAMPANDYTLEGRLVGHVVIGRDLLRESCAAVGNVEPDLQLHLEHLVLSHQGRKEYSSPVEPMTPEALVLHFVDDLDSKINQLEITRENGAGVHWHRGLGRYVWLAEGNEVWEGARAAPLDGYVDVPADSAAPPARHPTAVERSDEEHLGKDGPDDGPPREEAKAGKVEDGPVKDPGAPDPAVPSLFD